eukprot:1188811-Prorocentrum_minimum.AAC.2
MNPSGGGQEGVRRGSGDKSCPCTLPPGLNGQFYSGRVEPHLLGVGDGALEGLGVTLRCYVTMLRYDGVE